jgi:NADH:ubiquinone oxidoreductase subunit H
MSLLCTALQAIYLAIALVIFLGGWNVPAAGVVFLINGPLAAVHGLVLALLVIALVRAPKVLQTR